MKSEIPTLPDLNPYALKSELPKLPDFSDYARRTKLNDLTGYLRAREVEAMLAEKDRLIASLNSNLADEVSLRTREISRLEALLGKSRERIVVERKAVALKPKVKRGSPTTKTR